MATVILDANDSYTAASAVTIRGSSGSETVKIYDGVAVNLDSNVERVEFARASSAYQYKATANGVEVSYNGTVVTTLFSGDKAAFTDGSAVVAGTIVGSTLSFTLGGTAVPSTAGTVVPTLVTTPGEASTVGGVTGGAVAGQSFSLTANVAADVITGTAGNDTVTGAAGTIGTNDVIVDASTTDADIANLAISGTVGPTTFSNIETINAGFDFGATLDVSKVTGAKTLNLTAGVAGVNTAELVAVNSGTATSIVGDAAIKNIVLGGTAATGESAKLITKSATLALQLGKASAIETVALGTQGTASVVTVTNTNPPTTVNTSGDKNLTITEAVAGNMAGVTVNNGMDTGAVLTLKSIDTAGADYSKLAASAVLELSGAIAGAEIVNNTQSSVKLSGAAAAAGSIQAATGTANTLNLAVSAAQANTVTTTGFTTINLTNAVTNAAALTLTKGITATASTTLNISGAGDIQLGSAGNISTLKDVVATNATGNITAYLDASKVVKFTGGSGNDTVYVPTTVAATVVGGTGTDTLHVGADFSSVNFSGFEVLYADATTTKVNASQLTGQTLTLTGAGVQTLTIGSSNSTIDTQTIDLSKISVDTTKFSASGAIVVDGNTGTVFALAMNVTGTNASDSVLGGSAADTIDGRSGDDILKGYAGADTITGGEGADVITGGAGNDTINLAETVASIDKVVFETAGATAAATLTANGLDTINGWGQNDTINVAPLGDGTVSGGLTAITTAGAQVALTDDKAIVISTNGTAANLTIGGTAVVTDWTNLTQVAAYLNERFTTSASANNDVIVINDTTSGANKSYVFDYQDAATNGIASTEIVLVAVINNGGTALAAANVAYA